MRISHHVGFEAAAKTYNVGTRANFLTETITVGAEYKGVLFKRQLQHSRKRDQNELTVNFSVAEPCLRGLVVLIDPFGRQLLCYCIKFPLYAIISVCRPCSICKTYDGSLREVSAARGIEGCATFHRR